MIHSPLINFRHLSLVLLSGLSAHAADFHVSPTGDNNPLFPRLRSGQPLFQRPSPQKQIPSNNQSMQAHFRLECVLSAVGGGNVDSCDLGVSMCPWECSRVRDFTIFMANPVAVPILYLIEGPTDTTFELTVIGIQIQGSCSPLKYGDQIVQMVPSTSTARRMPGYRLKQCNSAQIPFPDLTVNV